MKEKHENIILPSTLILLKEFGEGFATGKFPDEKIMVKMYFTDSQKLFSQQGAGDGKLSQTNYTQGEAFDNFAYHMANYLDEASLVALTDRLLEEERKNLVENAFLRNNCLAKSFLKLELELFKNNPEKRNAVLKHHLDRAGVPNQSSVRANLMISFGGNENLNVTLMNAKPLEEVGLTVDAKKSAQLASVIAEPEAGPAAAGREVAGAALGDLADSLSKDLAQQAYEQIMPASKRAAFGLKKAGALSTTSAPSSMMAVRSEVKASKAGKGQQSHVTREEIRDDLQTQLRMALKANPMILQQYNALQNNPERQNAFKNAVIAKLKIARVPDGQPANLVIADSLASAGLELVRKAPQNRVVAPLVAPATPGRRPGRDGKGRL